MCQVCQVFDKCVNFKSRLCQVLSGVASVCHVWQVCQVYPVCVKFVKCVKCVKCLSIVCQVCVSCVLNVSPVGQRFFKFVSMEWMGGRPVSSEICEVCQVFFKCV